MKPFADLLDGLVYTPSRNGKLRLLVEYFRSTPDPDRGWALAALTDGLNTMHDHIVAWSRRASPSAAG